MTTPLLAATVAAALLVGMAAPARAADPDPTDWAAVREQARGQIVNWYAWGGSDNTNAFIAWIADRVEQDAGVTLRHVKLSDTSEAVTRVLSERQAGRDEGGAVDLIWINGANFAAMKDADLLWGPWAEALPNRALADDANKPLDTDFTIPTDGFESPWAMAQVVFMHDTADLPDPLADAAAILAWAEANPGRMSYPQPPDFLGTTFLKQMLLDLAEDPQILSRDAEDVDYASVTAPLWEWLDRLTPVLWRAGRAYPATGPAQLQLISDDEIDLAISFSPGEASAAIADGRLPDTVRTFVLERGTLANASFVAIPYNSGAKAGALVVADALLSPEAQLRALDPEILGYGTVLDMDALDPAMRDAFAALDLGAATLSPDQLGPALPEPHPSWAVRLASDWQERYGVE